MAYATQMNIEFKGHYLANNREGNWLERTFSIVHSIEKWVRDHSDNRYNMVLAIEEPMIPRFDRVGAASIQNRFLGILLAKMFPFKHHVYLVNPRSVKKVFTGDGNAKKDMLIERALDLYEHSHRTKPGKECIADSIAIAYTCWKYLVYPNLTKGVTRVG